MTARWLLLVSIAACAPEIATPAEQQAAADRAAGDRVAAILAKLPGVLAADVEVRRPRTQIVIVGDDQADAARALADASGLPAPRVTIARIATPAAAGDLARVGPFTVAASSAAALRATLLALLAVIAAAAAAVAARYRRRGNSAQ